MWRHLNQPFALWPKTEHFSKQSNRFHVFARLKLGDGTLNIHKDLINVEGSKASSHATIKRWHDLFCFNDKDWTNVTPFSQRQPQTRKKCLQPQKVWGQTHVFVYGKYFQSLHCRWATFISEGSLQGGYRTKLTDIQEACRVDNATYLFNPLKPRGPKRLTNVVIKWNWDTLCSIASKRRSAAWLGPEDQRHPVCKPGFQSKKRLFWIFFSKKGHVEVDVSIEKSAITGYCTGRVLPKVVQEMVKKKVSNHRYPERPCPPR